MAKNKDDEALYKAEGRRRAYLRKQKRFEKYVESIPTRGKGGAWRDPESPTGWSQKCDYRGNCPYPCNGDC